MQLRSPINSVNYSRDDALFNLSIKARGDLIKNCSDEALNISIASIFNSPDISNRIEEILNKKLMINKHANYNLSLSNFYLNESNVNCVDDIEFIINELYQDILEEIRMPLKHTINNNDHVNLVFLNSIRFNYNDQNETLVLMHKNENEIIFCGALIRDHYLKQQKLSYLLRSRNPSALFEISKLMGIIVGNLIIQVIDPNHMPY